MISGCKAIHALRAVTLLFQIARVKALEWSGIILVGFFLINLCELSEASGDSVNWAQKEFVIGTFWDPPVTGNREKDIDKSYRLAKEAYFNLLSGFNGTPPADPAEEYFKLPGESRDYNSNVYRLSLAAEVGLKYLVKDFCIGDDLDPGHLASFIKSNPSRNKPICNVKDNEGPMDLVPRNYLEEFLAEKIANQLPELDLGAINAKVLRDALFGYYLDDEPNYRNVEDPNAPGGTRAPREDELIVIAQNQADRVRPWIKHIKQYNQDPTKLAFVNFGLPYTCGEDFRLNGVSLRYFLADDIPENEQPDVVAFDSYPFAQEGFDCGYFEKLSLVRDKAGSRPFWAYPRSVYGGAFDRPDAARLRFEVFSPIAYGAKGLVYFTYTPPHFAGGDVSEYCKEDKDGNKKYDALLTYDTAVECALDKDLSGDDRYGTPSDNYFIVKRINHYINEVLAPVVMNAMHVGTLHKKQTPSGVVIPEGELITGDRNQGLIRNISNANIMVGVFERDSTSYGLVVNKSLEPVNKFTITLNGHHSVALAPSVIDYPDTGGNLYSPVATRLSPAPIKTSFDIASLAGGEGRLFRVSSPQKVNAYFLDVKPEETTQILGMGTQCGGLPHQFEIHAPFKNIYTGTTLSGLLFEVKELSGGNTICTLPISESGQCASPTAATGAGATILATPLGAYSDQLLSPGEVFTQVFLVCLKEIKPFRLVVDLYGNIAEDGTAPSLIQGTRGPENNNFELVVREADSKLHHYFRFPVIQGGEIIRHEWRPGSETFAEGSTSAPSLIQSTLGPEGDNLEVVVRGPDRKLHHYFRQSIIDDEGKEVFEWLPGSETFASNSTSAPALIQSDLGTRPDKLEVVVRESDNRLHHYFRRRVTRDGEEVFEWALGDIFANDVTSAPALIQSNLGSDHDNFEVVVRQKGDRLHHYFRRRVTRDGEEVFEWKHEDVFANDVTSAPALIQSKFGDQNDNFEVVVRQADNRLHHYFRHRVVRDGEEVFEWASGGDEPSGVFAQNVTSAPTLIQSSLGSNQDNLEVVVRQADNKLHHYFRRRVDDGEGDFEWVDGGEVTQR